MMGIIKALAKLLSKFSRQGPETQEPEKAYFEVQSAPPLEEVHSIWDYLKFKENTQAFHLASVLGFEEWVDMEEIRRRIKEVFGEEYRNERSLYPYLKTMVDIGLMESTNVGGRRKWRKRDILIRTRETGRKEREAWGRQAAGEAKAEARTQTSQSKGKRVKKERQEEAD